MCSQRIHATKFLILFLRKLSSAGSLHHKTTASVSSECLTSLTWEHHQTKTPLMTFALHQPHALSSTWPEKEGTKISRCSSPLCKMAQCLCITYAHPPIYFKSSLDYLEYLMPCKSYVYSYQYAVNSSFGTFWDLKKIGGGSRYIAQWVKNPTLSL